MSASVQTARDQFDLPITSADPSAGEGYDDYVREYISYGSALRNLFQVADENPAAPLLNAHAAALHMAFEGAEGWAASKPYFDRMVAAKGSGTQREQLFCSAVEAWSEKDFHGSLSFLDELTVRWPADICAIKWGQYHAFNLGDQPALLRFGERARIAHEDRPYTHGMIAFALEQNHRIREAEEEGLRATEIAIDDAWAHHAVAHVMETEHRAKDGARWLKHCAHTWDKKGTFIREHNWWHAALFQLALGGEREALDIFDNHLWGEWPEFPQEQIGAISLLWRLELRGVSAGARWAPVVEQVRTRKDEHYFPFHDLHYVYALARAGEPGDADRFLEGMRMRAENAIGEARETWGRVAVPTAEALVAFVNDDFATAREKLSPVMGALHRIGGSHAQRHIFQETLEAVTAPAAASGRQL